MWGQGQGGFQQGGGFGGQQGGWGGQQGGSGGQQGGWGGQQGGSGGQQGGFVNLGGQGGMGVGINLGAGIQNRWGNNNNNYHQMNGFQQVDYSGGWNNNHDQRLQQGVQMVYQRYDQNRSGQLQGQEFFYAYRDLCLQMGMAPPNSYQDVWNAVQQCDTNRDGQVSQWEMFNLFKRIQGVQGGMMMNQNSFGGGNMGGGFQMQMGSGW